MSDDVCQCPICGRMHKSLGFGAPPESIANTHPAYRKGMLRAAEIAEAQPEIGWEAFRSFPVSLEAARRIASAIRSESGGLEPIESEDRSRQEKTNTKEAK